MQLKPSKKGFRAAKNFDTESTRWAMFHVSDGCHAWETSCQDDLLDILSPYFEAVGFYQNGGDAGQSYSRLSARWNVQGRLIVYMFAGLDI